MAPDPSVCKVYWRQNVAKFACGWTLRHVPLDAEGRDASGWHWGHHADGELWGCFNEDASETVTVRAREIYAAVDKLLEHGMPPRILGKIGWSSLK